MTSSDNVAEHGSRLPAFAPTEHAPLDAGPSRARWVDDARGVGIVLVVAGHAIGGILSAGIASAEGGYPIAFQAIYSFHMPLFFLLSGLFCRRYERGKPTRHIAKLAKRVLYPYAIWSIVTLTVIGALGTLVNSPYPVGLGQYVAILWAPPAQLWFLYALFVLNVFYILLLSRIGAGWLLVLALIARLAPVFFQLPQFVELTANYAIFFAAGALWTAPIFAFASRLSRAGALAATAAALVAWAAAFSIAWASGFGYLSLAIIPASVVGTAMVVFGAIALANSRVADLLGYLGRVSMPIFLLHVLFVAGTRIVFVKLLHFDNATLLFPLLIASGLVGSILVYEVSRRMKFSRALGFE